MKLAFTAAALALLVAGPAQAKSIDPAELRVKLAKLVQIIQRIKQAPRPGVAAETVSCTGADGTSVSFATSASQDRPLTGGVTARVAGQAAFVPASQVSSYLNEDAGIRMAAYRSGAGSPAFELDVALVATTQPRTDEVATYSGTATLGTSSRPVTCSAVRKGAGTLKSQTPTGDLAVACYRDGNQTTAPIVTFSVARSASRRLISDINEQRAATDFETLPSFLVSQYQFSKQAISIEIDDASPEGNPIAAVKARGVRVPTGQPAADPTIYGIWAGTYERFDDGRRLMADVTCYAY